jgi:N-acetylglucosaminyldiphosphoundecaprenol N-acetyl-beta-D-mannosaminyltransferase
VRGSSAAEPSRLWLGNVPVDCVTLEQALERIATLVERGEGGTVFTPNVDHLVLAEEDHLFREAYASVDLSLVDGMPLLWASRMLGHSLPEKVSGSDLIHPLMSLAAQRGFRVYLLGASPGVARRAAEILLQRLPGLEIVGTMSPLIDMGRQPSERDDVRRELRAARAHLVLVALGSPKGETFVHECRATLGPAVFVGVGAGLDFLAGVVRRAPPWVSASGLEWLYRLAREPRRLWKRYLVRGPRVLPILLRPLVARSRAARRAGPASR